MRRFAALAAVDLNECVNLKPWAAGSAMHSLVLTYAALGRIEESLDLSRQTLDLRQKHCPDDHLEIGDAHAAAVSAQRHSLNFIRQLHDFCCRRALGIRAVPESVADF